MPDLISLDKKYKTRGGSDVRIYAVDGGGAYPVHGAYKHPLSTTWVVRLWQNCGHGHYVCSEDLVEVIPTCWVNVYSQGMSQSSVYHKTREEADKWAGNCRVACLEFTEGQGLKK